PPNGAEAALPLGRSSPELARLMAEQGVQTAAFITAWNPANAPLSEAENLAAQATLKARLESAGLRWVAAEGRDPDGGWDSEPSLVVLGGGFAAACALGDDFGQIAFLFCGPDAALRLVFCRLGQAPEGSDRPLTPPAG